MMRATMKIDASVNYTPEDPNFVWTIARQVLNGVAGDLLFLCEFTSVVAAKKYL